MSPAVPCLPPGASSASPGRLGRLRAALLALVAALGVIAAAPSVAGAAPFPSVDPFWEPPADLASRAPGDVIRTRPAAFRSTPNLKLPFRAWHVLYRTTDRTGKPIATVATIIQPQKRPATGRRLVSYQTAYDGLGPGCRPSYSMAGGKVGLQGAETVLIMGLLARGWTVVTSDYEGPDDQWGVATTTGRGVLDGIRAALNAPESDLDEGKNTKVGMLGYSGGGNATAWANEMAPAYAPELNIVGAAQGGVAADLRTMVKALDGELFAGIAFAGIVGVTSGYPEFNLDQYLNTRGKRMVRELRSKASACITDFFLKYAFTKFRVMTKEGGLFDNAEMMKVGADNALGKAAPKAPTYWYTPFWDQMNQLKPITKVVKGYCAAGTPVNYEIAYDKEHAMMSMTHPVKAQIFLQQRFNDAPMYNNCAAVAKLR